MLNDPRNAYESPIRGYRDLEQIGRGGFSVVCRATQESLGRTVAVKMMLTDLTQPDDVRRFTNECAILGRLGAHKHVVDVYDAGITDDGRPFIVMKLYERGTLADTIRANGPLPVADVVAIGTKLAGALQAAHDIGVIHRDIKPDNVLLDDDGEPVLSDFGVAAVADAAGQYTTSVAFSRAHVAPEVLDRNEFGVTSDVYSLGSTLYTLLTGRAAFEASTEARQIVAIMTAPVPEITRHGVPPELAELIADSLAKEPSERVQSAAELRRRLMAVDLTTVVVAQSTAGPQDHVEPVQAAPVGTAIDGLVAQPGTDVEQDEFELTRRRTERSPVAAAPMPMSAAGDDDVEVTRRKTPAAPVPVRAKADGGDAAPPSAEPTRRRSLPAASGSRSPDTTKGDQADEGGYTAPEATRLRTTTVDMSASRRLSRPITSPDRPLAKGLPRTESVNRSLADSLAALEFETTALPRGYTEKVAETLSRRPIDIGETECWRIVPFVEDLACADEDSEPGAVIRVPRGGVATGVLFAFTDRVVLAAGRASDLAIDVFDHDEVLAANWVTVRHRWRSWPGYALSLSAGDVASRRVLFLDVDPDVEMAERWWECLDEVFIAG